MVHWGYLASFGYLAVIIAFFELINRKFKVNVEITRKILHILIGFTWVIMDIFWGVSYHQIIMCAVFLVVNAVSMKLKIFKSIEREKGKNHFGTVYYASAMLSLAIASYFYTPLYMPFGMAVMCLSFGDGFAPIFARIFKNHNIVLTKEKTLVGTLACAVFSFLALLVFNVCYNLEYSILSLVCISLSVGVIELLVGFGLDNFGITFSVSLLALFIKSGTFNQTFLILFILSSIYILLVVLSKALTTPACLLAYCMLFIASFTAETAGFLIFVCPFTIIALAGIQRKKILKKRGIEGEKQKRNFMQVLLNGGIATLMLLLFKILGKEYFFCLAGISLAEAFADSLASDIGSLSNRPPIDIVTRKKSESGLSGCISLLGTCSAFLGSVAVGLLSLVRQANWITFVCISVFGFLGTFIDSLLGSTVQSLYQCEKCGKYTEKKEHCNEKTRLIKGWAFLSNNAVNIMSNIFTVCVSALILVFVL